MSSTQFSYFNISTVLTLALLCGCAAGPDFHEPAAPEVAAYSKEPLPAETVAADVHGGGGGVQRFVSAMDIPAQWWTLFHSESLNAVILRALQANPDLQASQAALRAAQENTEAQRGSYYPAASASLSPSRQKIAQPISSPLVSGDSLFNLHTAQLSISYAPDVFGLARRQVENLQSQADAQRFVVEATYLTLTSNVSLAAIQEASLRAQITATQEVIRIGAEILELMQKQVDLGAIPMADVIAQQALLAQAQATLPALQKQLAQQRTLLTALTGGFPDAELSEQFDLTDLTLPADLPVSLPSALVAQRPDVRAASAQLHAATAQVGIAQANMLPQITLNADLGSSAVQISKLFTVGSSFWSIAGGLTQPIFAGGELLHKKRAAEALLDQASAQYRGTVISAFQNVADTLRALQYDAATLRAQTAAEAAAAQSLDISRKALQMGAISYLAVLTSQQTYQQSVINLVQARAGRYADTVALFQALGGGWWNRPESSSAM